MITDRDLTTAALASAARGWHVFPLRPGQKRPLAGFTEWERHATTDPGRVRSFWSTGPYNVAVACGPSKLVVIDLDVPERNGTPPAPWNLPGIREGADVLALLCERHRRPWPGDTFTVRTRRGGTHLYFTPPPGLRLTNTTGGSPSLGWRIDTRAHGGYVLAPGSFVDLPDGAGTYEVLNGQPPAPLPDWLTGLLNPAPAPLPALGCAPATSDRISDLDAYTRAALQAEAKRVTGAAHGGRNHALNKAAYHLGRLIGAQLFPEDLAATALYEAASVHFGPAKQDMSPSETRATIRSGLSAGIRNPRRSPGGTPHDQPTIPPAHPTRGPGHG